MPPLRHRLAHRLVCKHIWRNETLDTNTLTGCYFSDLSLAERIERLSLALGNARSGLTATLDASDYIQDLEERLDVAKVQNEVLEEVIAMYGQVAEVPELNCTLYDVSQLFNRFARPLKLWEASLSILHCSSYQDPLLVHQMWTNIIDQSIGRKNFDLLSQKIAEITKKLYPSPFAFPLNFVMDYVMQVAIRHSQPPEWIVNTFGRTAIPLTDLLKQICDLIESKATFWAKRENKKFLLEIFIALGNKSLDYNSGHHMQVRLLASHIEAVAKATGSLDIYPNVQLLQERLKKRIESDRL